MKIAAYALCAAILGFSISTTTIAFGAEPASLPMALHQNFDDQIPGDQPNGWRKIWGDDGDDQIEISNIYSVSPNNSLLLDRATGTNESQWGFGCALPDIQKGWLVTSFDFLVDGAGDISALGFEIRPKSGGGRVCSIGLKDFAVSLSGAPRNGGPLGKITADHWYRLTLWLPTYGGGQAYCVAVLNSRDASGSWQPMNPIERAASVAPAKGYGILTVNTAPKKRGYRLYIDDVSCIEQDNAEPPAPSGNP